MRRRRQRRTGASVSELGACARASQVRPQLRLAARRRTLTSSAVVTRHSQRTRPRHITTLARSRATFDDLSKQLTQRNDSHWLGRARARTDWLTSVLNLRRRRQQTTTTTKNENENVNEKARESERRHVGRGESYFVCSCCCRRRRCCSFLCTPPSSLFTCLLLHVVHLRVGARARCMLPLKLTL